MGNKKAIKDYSHWGTKENPMTDSHRILTEYAILLLFRFVIKRKSQLLYLSEIIFYINIYLLLICWRGGIIKSEYTLIQWIAVIGFEHSALHPFGENLYRQAEKTEWYKSLHHTAFTFEFTPDFGSFTFYDLGLHRQRFHCERKHLLNIQLVITRGATKRMAITKPHITILNTLFFILV